MFQPPKDGVPQPPPVGPSSVLGSPAARPLPTPLPRSAVVAAVAAHEALEGAAAGAAGPVQPAARVALDARGRRSGLSPAGGAASTGRACSRPARRDRWPRAAGRRRLGGRAAGSTRGRPILGGPRRRVDRLGPTSAARSPAAGVAAAAGSSAFGSSALGSSALGSSAFGSSAFGSSALGSSALGSSALGSSALGSSAFGSSAFGSSAFGSSAFGARLRLLGGSGCGSGAGGSGAGCGSGSGRGRGLRRGRGRLGGRRGLLLRALGRDGLALGRGLACVRAGLVGERRDGEAGDREGADGDDAGGAARDARLTGGAALATREPHAGLAGRRGLGRSAPRRGAAPTRCRGRLGRRRRDGARGTRPRTARGVLESRPMFTDGASSRSRPRALPRTGDLRGGRGHRFPEDRPGRSPAGDARQAAPLGRLAASPPP